MTSIGAKQSLVTFVVSDPDDSELRAERGLAGNRVQGLPSIRQLEADGPEFVLVDQDLGLGHRSISFR